MPDDPADFRDDPSAREATPQQPPANGPSKRRSVHGITDDEWGPEVTRTNRGGLPLKVLIPAILIFIIGFILFRQWRSQYVDWSDTGGSEALAAIVSLLQL